jgi:hypothetical protein
MLVIRQHKNLFIYNIHTYLVGFSDFASADDLEESLKGSNVTAEFHRYSGQVSLF